ncbi:MAG TPA: peptide transporter [Planctomycetes bacterium]|nr:peptide transporter [Planctomycetota bacterium]
MRADAELERYRSLMTPPGTFSEGFSLHTLIGVILIALILVPGALYMQLLAGQGVGAAAQWVTLILFLEVAKRANAKIGRAQIFVLFYMAGTFAYQNVHATPLWNQFLARSEAALSFGLAGQFPEWFAPSDPAAYESRSFLTSAWIPAIGLLVFKQFFSRLDSAVAGFGLFRLTSDIEKLPFPMAPIGAQGMMALADDLDGQDRSGGWRWRVFSIGSALGLVFGAVYIAIPTLSANFWGEANKYSVLPIPFVETSHYTSGILPAVATGLSFDFSQLIVGMVLPFWAMVGSFIGLIVTLVLNPVLYHVGVLRTWIPGDSTVETMFKNSVDFYLSFGIGISLAVAVVGIWGMLRTLRRKRDLDAAEAAAGTKPVGLPEGRGDIPNRWILGIYVVATLLYIAVSGWLVDWHTGVLLVLVFFGFIYTPLISYVTARLEGIAGQVVEIPFIRELSLIVSGYNGIAVWFIPLPQANYGTQTVLYRQAELTGTKFTSLWKAEAAIFPAMLVMTLLFASFIWGLAEIPSGIYPYAQQIWELDAKNACLVFSSTAGGYSQFQEALSGPVVGIGLVLGTTLFGALSAMAAPVTLCYGVVRGLGQTMPHVIIPQIIGALLGRYYFEKKLGLMWGQYVPVLAAGVSCGFGLVSMLCIGIVFLVKSSNAMPY